MAYFVDIIKKTNEANKSFLFMFFFMNSNKVKVASKTYAIPSDLVQRIKFRIKTIKNIFTKLISRLWKISKKYLERNKNKEKINISGLPSNNIVL